MLSLAVASLATISLVAGHPNGAGQCTIPADITVANAIAGMSTRGRTGTNTVTVTPATQVAGGKVTIKVDAPAGQDINGVLAAAYAADAVVGTHAVVADKTKTCVGDNAAAMPAANTVITHSQKLTGSTLSWEYTIPAAQTAPITVKVITLNNNAGTQAFALGTAALTIGAAGATTTPGAGATTTGADAPNCASADADKTQPCQACFKLTGCQYVSAVESDFFTLGGSCISATAAVPTGKKMVPDNKSCADYCGTRSCSTCIDSPMQECVWCDTVQATVGLKGKGSCERTKCTLGSKPITDKTKCSSAASVAFSVVGAVIAVIAML